VGPLLSLRAVAKAYQTPAGPFWALRDINGDFQRGEFVAVVGKSGAGKSTLVNMIAGVDALSEGRVCVNGIDLHALNESALARFRGLHIGVVYQSFELLPQISLLDNVMLPMEMCGLYRGQQSRGRALELLRQVGLADHAGKTPGEISGGQKQRAAIARALANDPALIVADEPTGNLDSETAADILALFEWLAAAGKTVILVTHDAALEERATRLLRMADGEIVDERLN
jgi:putative ABC transport system ATP-binding protein